MTEDETKALIDSLFKATIGVGRKDRLRVLVTPTEYHAIRQHMLKKFGRFHNRIGDVTIKIDEDPVNTYVSVEYPDGKS